MLISYNYPSMQSNAIYKYFLLTALFFQSQNSDHVQFITPYFSCLKNYIVAYTIAVLPDDS